MKKIWSRIWNTFKSFSFREWFFILLSICLMVISLELFFNPRTKIIYEPTEKEIIYTKDSTEYKAKTILIQENKELKRTNDSLYNEFKKIKDRNPLVITKTVTNTKIDTLYLVSNIEKVSPDKFNIRWGYSESFDQNNYFHINGVTQTDTLWTTPVTILENLEIVSDLTLDIVKSNANNAMRIIARSNNPRVTISSLDGVVLDPSKNEVIKSYFPKKRWGFGIYGGIGSNFDINNKKISFGPQIGVGVSYNILTW